MINMVVWNLNFNNQIFKIMIMIFLILKDFMTIFHFQMLKIYLKIFLEDMILFKILWTKKMIFFLEDFLGIKTKKKKEIKKKINKTIFLGDLVILEILQILVILNKILIKIILDQIFIRNLHHLIREEWENLFQLNNQQ